MKMLINGKKVDASDGQTQNIVNPATQEIMDTVPKASLEDIKQAIDYAVEGQKQWNKELLRDRVAKLREFARLVKERRLELGEVLAKETGKPYMKEAVWEFDSVAYIVEGACEVALHHYGKTMPTGGTEPGYEDDIQFTLHEPLGVIACIIPFNFPVALWAHKIGAALATGNAILVKAPSPNPLALMMLHEILVEVGIPGSVVQCLTGSGAVIGDAIVKDERIASVNFTGSTGVGKSIAKNAAESLTGYQFELGGNDPFIVCADADMDLVVKEAGDKCRNSGQACSAAKRFIVHHSKAKEFVDRLIKEQIAPLTIGNPMDETTDMGPLITESAAKGVEQQVNETVAAGAKLVYGGTRENAFYVPAVLTNVTPDMDIAKDMEVFGPVFPVIEFDTIDEAITIANGSNYGLGSGVLTQDMKTAFKVAKELQTGHVAINGSGGFRASELPFGGGKKLSGNSRESFVTVMDEVTQQKSIILRYILAE